LDGLGNGNVIPRDVDFPMGGYKSILLIDNG